MTYKINNAEIARLRTGPKVFNALERMAKDGVETLSENGRVKGYFYKMEYARKNRAAVAISGWGHAKESNKKHQSLVKLLDVLAEDVVRKKSR